MGQSQGWANFLRSLYMFKLFDVGCSMIIHHGNGIFMGHLPLPYAGVGLSRVMMFILHSSGSRLVFYIFRQWSGKGVQQLTSPIIFHNTVMHL